MRTKAQRKKNLKADEDVLLKSKRRCCLCFGLKRDDGEKKGQIAHLDHDPANDTPDNLAYLCLEHHDQYDCKTSQSKSLQMSEVKTYRERLYQFVASNEFPGGETLEKPEKNKSSKPLSARAFNAYLVEKPHKCGYCGYSFWIMPELVEGMSTYVKAATCPKCGNIDEVGRFYQG